VTSPILVAPESSSVSDPKSTRSLLDSAVFYGVFGLLLFGPLAFGATEPWSIFVLEFSAALLFIVWLMKQAMSSELRITGNPLFPPMLAFAGLIFAQLMFGRSAYRYATFSGALLYCAYGMLCFLAAQCLRRGSQVKKLAVIVSVYGSAVALFALLQGLAPNGKLYWLREPRSGGWIYGPYVNHNHYAGLMEMLVPIPLVYCFTRYAHGERRIIAGAAAVIMASTVFLSGSRGGMLALAVEMALFATALMTRERRPKPALAGGVFLLVILSVLTWIGGGELTSRMTSIGTEARTELSGGMRLAIDRDGLRMFAKKSVLGWGLGVFPVVYPQFRSFYTNVVVNRAHDDYLQLLAEMGALGFATMLWFLVVLYRSSIKKLDNWAINISGTISLAALLGCAGILVHGFVDSNLQIPANAALFYVLCVLAASKPLTESRRHRRSHRTEMQETGALPEAV